MSCSCADFHTWHGQRRERRPCWHPRQRPSGSAQWVVRSSRQPSARRFNSLRASGSSVLASAWPAARSSMSRRCSTARRTVSSVVHTSAQPARRSRARTAAWSRVSPSPRACCADSTAAAPGGGTRTILSSSTRTINARSRPNGSLQLTDQRGSVTVTTSASETADQSGNRELHSIAGNLTRSSGEPPIRVNVGVAVAARSALNDLRSEANGDAMSLSRNRQIAPPGCSAVDTYGISFTWRPAPSDPQAG